MNKFQRMVAISDKVESRLNTEMNQFCDTVAISLGLSSQDMMEFNTALEKDKSSQHRVLKAKFAVRIVTFDLFPFYSFYFIFLYRYSTLDSMLCLHSKVSGEYLRQHCEKHCPSRCLRDSSKRMPTFSRPTRS